MGKSGRHVVQLIPTLNRIGGAERQLLLLSRELHRRGWQVSVVTLSGDGGDVVTELCRDGIAYHSLKMRHSLLDVRGWWRWVHWLLRERPEIVHAHLPHALWISRWSRLFMRYPRRVDTLHTPAVGPWSRKLAFALTRSLPHHTTAVSKAVEDAFLAHRLVRAERLGVLPNAVDCGAWKPDQEERAIQRRKLQIRDEFVWLAVGRLEPVKDFSLLLSAFAELPNNCVLYVVGSGPLEAELRAQAWLSRLNERVRFPGFQSNLLPWMLAADGFVLSSRWEGLPMALLEASACGVPSVTVDLPGAREVVADEPCDAISGRDAAALSHAMLQLMQCPAAERIAMGLRARERVLTNFSVDAVLTQWEHLYLTLISELTR